MTAPGEAFKKGSDLFEAVTGASKELKGKIIFVSGLACSCLRAGCTGLACCRLCLVVGPPVRTAGPGPDQRPVSGTTWPATLPRGMLPRSAA